MEGFAAFEEFPEEVQVPSQPAQPKAQYYIDEEEVRHNGTLMQIGTNAIIYSCASQGFCLDKLPM